MQFALAQSGITRIVFAVDIIDSVRNIVPCKLLRRRRIYSFVLSERLFHMNDQLIAAHFPHCIRNELAPYSYSARQLAERIKI